MKRIEISYGVIGLFLGMLLQSIVLPAQGWKKEYDYDIWDQGYDVLETQDQGFLVGGTVGIAFDDSELTLVKTDVTGAELWHQTYPFQMERDGNKRMLELSDGSFAVVGTSNDGQDVALLKVSSAGNLLWSATFDDSGVANKGFSIDQTSSGDFILAGQTMDTMCTCERIFLIKTDPQGSMIWQKVLPGIHGYTGHSLVVLDNGEIVVAGNHSSSNGLHMYVVKTDAQGTIIWEWETPIGSLSLGQSIIATSDGDLLVAGNATLGTTNAEEIRLLRLDQSGNTLLDTTYNSLFKSFPQDIIETPDQNYLITGSYGQPTPGLSSFLMKVDGSGNEIWTNTFDWYGTYDGSQSVVNTTDGGYAFAGIVNTIPGVNTYDMYLAKTDSLGYVYSNYITGKVFDDDNVNCQLEVAEDGLSQWVVKVEGDIETFFTLSDSTGAYSILVDTGAYEVSIAPYAYWEPCQDFYPIQFSSFYNTQTLNLPLQASEECPFMEVFIGSPFLRACADNYYSIQYCNYGTTEGEDVTVEVTLDANATYIGASVPLLSQTGPTYTFDVGDVAAGACGYFIVDFSLPCDTTLIGQTLCSQAHIYPDSICGPGLWNGPIIEVVGECTTTEDSVTFTLKNVGMDMQLDYQYIVIEDNIILFQAPYQLAFNAEEEITIPASVNATYHLLTGQGLGFPYQLGNPIASASVEACLGMSSPGAYNQIPEDDGEPYLSEFCTPVVASFDPNDKRAFPAGWTEDHCIDATTDLEYHIRFQNTGTDTAFQVMILDTLSTFLNPRTIQPGASSHPYTYQLLGSGVLQFSFPNIMLPDSNANEIASHGFISFKIDQFPNNNVGTMINNSAAIYFDFNAPVITNETFHTICDPWVQFFPVATRNIASFGSVKVYPNPLQTTAIVEIPDFIAGSKGRFILYDLQGRIMQENYFQGDQFTFDGTVLPAGIYGYEINIDGRSYSAGKIVIAQ